METKTMSTLIFRKKSNDFAHWAVHLNVARKQRQHLGQKNVVVETKRFVCKLKFKCAQNGMWNTVGIWALLTGVLSPLVRVIGTMGRRWPFDIFAQLPNRPQHTICPYAHREIQTKYASTSTRISCNCKQKYGTNGIVLSILSMRSRRMLMLDKKC